MYRRETCQGVVQLALEVEDVAEERDGSLQREVGAVAVLMAGDQSPRQTLARVPKITFR